MFSQTHTFIEHTTVQAHAHTHTHTGALLCSQVPAKGILSHLYLE